MVAEQRCGDPVLVAAVAQLAEELVDQVAPVGEDQDAAGARGLDEAERRDRLAGAGRVLEPEAPGGVRGPRAARRPRRPPRRRRPSRAGPRRLSSSRLFGQVLLAGNGGRGQRRGLVVLRGGGGVGVVLRLGQQRGQGPRQRVDLVGGEHRAVDQRRARPPRGDGRGRAGARSAGATRRTDTSGRRRARRARRRARAAPRSRARGRPRPPPPRRGRARGRTRQRARCRRALEGKRPERPQRRVQPRRLRIGTWRGPRTLHTGPADSPDGSGGWLLLPRLRVFALPRATSH